MATLSPLFPPEIWTDYLLVNLPIKNRAKTLLTLRCVSKIFLEICSQNLYWNPLLISSLQHHRKGNNSLKTYFNLKVILPTKKKTQQTQAQLMKCAEKLRQLNRKPSLLYDAKHRALLDIERRNYQAIRWKIEDQMLHNLYLHELFDSISRSLPKKFNHNSKYPLKGVLQKCHRLYTAWVIFVESGLILPPRSIRECHNNRSEVKKISLTLIGAITLIFMVCVGLVLSSHDITY